MDSTEWFWQYDIEWEHSFVTNHRLLVDWIEADDVDAQINQSRLVCEHNSNNIESHRHYTIQNIIFISNRYYT